MMELLGGKGDFVGNDAQGFGEFGGFEFEDDGVVAGFENFESFLFNVEAQAGFAVIFVRAVALVAILGKDWADVAIVKDGGGAR